MVESRVRHEEKSGKCRNITERRKPIKMTAKNFGITSRLMDNRECVAVKAEINFK